MNNAIGGPAFSVALIIGGSVVWLVLTFAIPIELEFLRWHLLVTGTCAIVVGLGLARSRLGRKRFR